MIGPVGDDGLVLKKKGKDGKGGGKKARSPNLLDMRPRRLVEWTIEEMGDRKGLVNVSMPKFRNFIGKHFCDALERPRDITVRLDPFGTFVWLRCDGKTTVEDIGEGLKKEFGKKVSPVFDRLAYFLMTLQRQQMISYEDGEATEEKKV